MSNAAQQMELAVNFHRQWGRIFRFPWAAVRVWFLCQCDFLTNVFCNRWHNFQSSCVQKCGFLNHSLYCAPCYGIAFVLRTVHVDTSCFFTHHSINPLKPELNPICYLLALLGAHHFLHVSRIRVKLLTFRRLMAYIYGAPILDVSRSHTTTQHSR